MYKNLKLFLVFICGAACAFGAANDLLLQQVKPTGAGNTERRVTATPDSLIGFDANSRPVNITAGTNITITGNQISATGGGSASFPLTDSVSIAPSTANARLTFTNSGTATNANPRYSPYILQEGFTYNSVGGAKSMRFRFGVETRSNTGGTQAGEFVIDSSLDSGAWSQALRLAPDGNLSVPYIQTTAGFIVSATDITATTGLISLGNSLKLVDTAGSAGSLILKTATTGSDDALTFNVNGASRSLTISGDATISGTHSGASSGTNTGDQTSVTGNAGTATALQTARSIYGNNFDGTAALSQIIASTYGGTGNGFAKLSGPASSEKTFTLPNASATILTDNAAVTVAQGGTGRATGTTAYALVATGTTATGAQQSLAAGATTEILVGGGASALPVWTTATGSGSPVRGTSPDFTTSFTTSSTSFTALAGATTLLTLGGTGASASTFFPSTLDATSSTTGAIRTSGGISAAKAANFGTTLTVAGHVTLEGVTSTGATGTGKLVFDTAPQLSAIELGAASDTTIARSAAGVITVEGNTVFAANTKTDVLQAADFAADAGANDTYTATLSPAITAYVTGARYRFKANTANTGAATINFNSVGAKTIVKVAGGITTTLADNDIRAGQWVECVYDGTNMQMASQLGNAASGSGDVVAASNNSLTGQNTSTLGIEFAWTSQSTGSQNYAVNKRYYISSFNANSTATFTGTPANGSTIIIMLIACDGTSTFTYPAAQRDGDATGTSTVITPTAGEHVLAFRYVNSLWYFADTITTAVVSDTAYGSGWNGVTTIAGSKNAVYDQLHIGDTDDDGKIDVLDQVAGLTNTNSSGVIQTPITTHAGLVAVVTDLNSASRTATNLTYDANGTGNVMKWIEEVNLTHPHQFDGTGAVVNTTSTSATYGHATFANGTAKATNYVIYRMTVPFDLDTATDLAASFAFRLGGSDTGKHAYKISMADVADSAGADSPTFSNEVNLYFTGDASGASGDVETVGYTTLTSWRSSLTAGHVLVIKLARDGNDGTNDTSTVDSTDVVLKLKIGHSQ